MFGASAPAAVPAAQLRSSGNAHFKAGRLDEACNAYTGAIGVAMRKLATPLPPADCGAVTRELVLCHTNLATCSLRLGRFADALDNSWAAAELRLTPGAPRCPRKVLEGEGWAWAAEAYEKALLLRARAAKAAGVPLSAYNHAGRNIVLPPGASSQAAAVRAELEGLQMEMKSNNSGPPAGASRECVVDGTWTQLRAAPHTPVPSPRRAVAGAVVAGVLYIFGGVTETASSGPHPRAGEMADAWRAPIALPADASAPAPRLRWEKLPRPSAHGGPTESNLPRGAACDALSLFVVLSRGALWTLQAGAGSDGTAWAALGSVWTGSPRAAHFRENDDRCALTVCGEAAYLLRDREGVVRVCLRTGERMRLRGSTTNAPLREEPHLWPAAGCTASRAKLRVWGGEETVYIGKPSDPPRATDMLIFDRGAWGIERRGGGGAAVPLPRGEAALVPMPRGGALLVGGFTDDCPFIGGNPPTRRDGGGVHIMIQATRLLNDAHLYDERNGWRAVRATGSAPPPGGQYCAAVDAASGVVCVLGGWGDPPAGQSSFAPQAGPPVQTNADHPLTSVYVLRLNGVPAAADAAAADDDDAPDDTADDEQDNVRRCEQCGAQASASLTLSRCGRCLAARYCSSECQRAAWPDHKRTCVPRNA